MSPQQPETRGRLTAQTSIKDFRDFYWLKSELEEFCREHGLSSSGGKPELAQRIEHFLQTGERLAPRPKPSARPASSRSTPDVELSLGTRTSADFRCSQELRVFFTSQLGASFRFTVTLQDYIKRHPGITLGEIAEEWKRQQHARQSGELAPEIWPQFQYNQFTRDFFSDPRNRGKTRQDCLEAWKRTRDRRGEKKYNPDAEP